MNCHASLAHDLRIELERDACASLQAAERVRRVQEQFEHRDTLRHYRQCGVLTVADIYWRGPQPA